MTAAAEETALSSHHPVIDGGGASIAYADGQWTAQGAVAVSTTTAVRLVNQVADYDALAHKDLPELIGVLEERLVHVLREAKDDATPAAVAFASVMPACASHLTVNVTNANDQLRWQMARLAAIIERIDA